MEKKEQDMLEMLQHIQKVDAPDFLLTRVREKISQLKSNRLSGKMAWGLGISFLLILAVNIAVLSKSEGHRQNGDSLVQSMNLTPDNTLYHE